MKIELTEMGPQLVQKSADTEKLLEYLSQETARADKVRGIVKADETQVKVSFLSKIILLSADIIFTVYLYVINV